MEKATQHVMKFGEYKELNEALYIWFIPFSFNLLMNIVLDCSNTQKGWQLTVQVSKRCQVEESMDSSKVKIKKPMEVRASIL